MRKTLLFFMSLVFFPIAVQGDLIITGVVDGPRTGGLPKAIELFALADIPDLSIYNVETPNNGGTATGGEFELSGSASKGDFIWVASESTGFSAYFGFAPSLVHSVANINGDDNVILYQNGLTIDQFGVNGQDGTGFPWEYLDGFAYRINDTGPDPLFVLGNWTFSGVDFLDSQGTSGVNGDDGKFVPFGTYSVSVIPEPGSIVVLSLFGLAMVAASRRRKVC